MPFLLNIYLLSIYTIVFFLDFLLLFFHSFGFGASFLYRVQFVRRSVVLDVKAAVTPSRYFVHVFVCDVDGGIMAAKTATVVIWIEAIVTKWNCDCCYLLLHWLRYNFLFQICFGRAISGCAKCCYVILYWNNVYAKGTQSIFVPFSLITVFTFSISHSSNWIQHDDIAFF